jgi:alpha-N-arabinofuranosidase
MTTNADLFTFARSDDKAKATLRIDASRSAADPVSPYLFGKFCEHLGHNIYQGMDAEILLNPTFARWVFNGGTDRVNGGMHAEYDPARIAQAATLRAQRFGLPDPGLLVEEYMDALAFGWFRLGTREEVRVSADVGPYGDRAQRIEVLQVPDGEPMGVAQWVYLPLHRTRGYTYRIVARAVAPVRMTISLAPADENGQPGAPLASDVIELGNDWATFEGTLQLPDGVSLDAEGRYRLSLVVEQSANLVIDRVLLYPDDHINYADPDIIRMLQDARLPLLRWPGGNFVSGYRWFPGVGPVDARPTLPNPAWESLEYNLYGTDEFLTYCKVVGCEPMICINAGDGTPEEAADWVEYCNGSVDTPMGRLRAENGHPEPYGVKLWEIGNELDGRHQVSWTTAGGYADRYNQFVKAMRAVDPDLRILACGFHTHILTDWNTALIDECADDLNTITHHVLNGGMVGERTDRVQLFHSFMGYAQPLRADYEALLDQMRAGGIDDPRVAITELQLFAHFQGTPGIGEQLSPATMPGNQTISEALYVATIIHECIRMGRTMEMITHSATVNHGGGLRKIRERVWGNPIHYGHVMLRELAEGTPVAVELSSDAFATNQSFSDGRMPPLDEVPAIDPMAVVSADGSKLILSMVHRSATTGPVEMSISLGDLSVQPEVEVVTLKGDEWWDANTEAQPERIVPQTASTTVKEGIVALTVAPYSLTRVTFTLA